MSCALCALPSKERFCCPGCETVFEILTAKGIKDNFTHTPLYQAARESGVISSSNSQVSRSFSNTKRLLIQVEGLFCPSCAQLIELVLMRLGGLMHCQVDYATDIASIEYAPQAISKDLLFSKIRSLGYEPRNLSEGKKTTTTTLRLSVAAFCALNIMMLSYPAYENFLGLASEGYEHLLGFISLILSLPVIFYSGWPIFVRFRHKITQGLFGLEALVSIGVFSAFILSIIELCQGGSKVYFDTLSMVIFFVLWGKLLESKAKVKSQAHQQLLVRLLPKRGRKLCKDGSIATACIKEIEIGDLLVVSAGEKIVLDGEIVEGAAAIDESLITGEAMPALRMQGHFVRAGSILKSGQIQVRVTCKEEESFLQSMIQLLQKEPASSNIPSLVDRITTYFVPSIILLSLAVGLFIFLELGLADAITRSLAILLIACPCALGVAQPLTESLLLSTFAQNGIIVRNRKALSFLGREDLYIFDKTGTLTEGKFRLLEGLEHLSLEDLCALKSLASTSIHPLSLAVVEAISHSACMAFDVQEIPGRGLKSKTHLLGSRSFMQEEGISIPNTLTTDTELFFATRTHLITRLLLGDVLRAPFKLDIDKMVLSGDGEGATEAVSKAFGINKWLSSCTPQTKQEIVSKAPGVTGMVGDGINDVLALRSADISIGIRPCDLSMQICDIVLTTPNLSLLQEMRKASLFARRISKQNLFWAFFYNMIGLFLAIFGYFPPIIAASAMTLSSLIVILNARRIQGHWGLK